MSGNLLRQSRVSWDVIQLARKLRGCGAMVFWSISHVWSARRPRRARIRLDLERTLNTALALHKAGKSDEAACLYAQVRRAVPTLFDGWFLAGALAFQVGRLDDAVTLLTRAERLSPDSAECQLFLGMALADLGRYAEAELPLRTALAKHPSFPEAWENLAKAMFSLGRPTEATVCLRRMLELQRVSLAAA